MSAHRSAGWLTSAELRVGLGCMRLSTDEDRDDDRALATIAEAVAGGVTVFDTARSYGHGADELGHNERLLARALRACGEAGSARIVTKGGMARAGGSWIPDGRARTIRSDCEASLAALDGLAIDVYLVHAPDPRTSWRTTLRALARLARRGPRRAASECRTSTAPSWTRRSSSRRSRPSQVALSPYDDRVLRGGIVERCAEHGHHHRRPLAARMTAACTGLARARAARPGRPRARREPAEVALAGSSALRPARRDPGRASAGDHALGRARGPARARRRRPSGSRRGFRRRVQRNAGRGRRRPRRGGDRSSWASPAPARPGWRGPCRARLRAPESRRARRLPPRARTSSLGCSRPARDGRPRQHVPDPAARSHVIEAAAHGLPARCVWLDTPLAQAQVNLVERLLDRFGSLPSPTSSGRWRAPSQA